MSVLAECLKIRKSYNLNFSIGAKNVFMHFTYCRRRGRKSFLKIYAKQSTVLKYRVEMCKVEILKNIQSYNFWFLFQREMNERMTIVAVSWQTNKIPKTKSRWSIREYYYTKCVQYDLRATLARHSRCTCSEHLQCTPGAVILLCFLSNSFLAPCQTDTFRPLKTPGVHQRLT